MERASACGAVGRSRRRSRRYYAITKAGQQEYENLLEGTLPFLGALARSLDGILGEIYG